MKVLYLAEWYPHRYDAMMGLFVRKHAEAVVRQGVEVAVLYVHPDQRVSENEIVAQTTHGVEEFYVYTPGSIGKALWQGWQVVREQWGMPDVVQVNVLSKTSLLAEYLRLCHHVPFVIVEHWSGYLVENYSFRGGWHGALMRYVARKASCIMPVSHYLGEAMRACGIQNRRWERIENVVDDFFYETSTLHPHPFTFLHVSCFDEKAKNVQGILRATKRLAEERRNFRMRIIGTGVNFAETKQLSDQLGLTDRIVFFEGERTPEEVAEAMKESDAFVLFSRYENAPVVLSEAMACGLPIIASRAGGIPEMVRPECGVLVPSEDEEALAEQLSFMIDHYADYDLEQIRSYGNLYKAETVGNKLKQIYSSCLH